MTDHTTRIYRVTIRGRFRDLTERARASLVKAAPEHDIFVSAYTVEGTLTYDHRIDFFNLRYEVRTTSPDEDPAALALVEAETFLHTLGLGHGPLTTNVVDMADLTS